MSESKRDADMTRISRKRTRICGDLRALRAIRNTLVEMGYDAADADEQALAAIKRGRSLERWSAPNSRRGDDRKPEFVASFPVLLTAAVCTSERGKSDA